MITKVIWLKNKEYVGQKFVNFVFGISMIMFFICLVTFNWIDMVIFILIMALAGAIGYDALDDINKRLNKLEKKFK